MVRIILVATLFIMVTAANGMEIDDQYISVATTSSEVEIAREENAHFLQKLAQIERAEGICISFHKKDILSCVEYLVDSE